METLDQVRTDFLNITATRYLSAAGLVIMLYDHLLTLDDEVEYVWKAKWSLPKTLFLVLRYMVPSAMIMYTYELSGIGEIHLSDTFCRGWFGSGLYLGIFSVSIGNFIVLLRLWVIWDRNIRLLLVTLSVFIATQIMTLAATTYMVVHWIPEVIFVEELHMCGMVAKPPLVMLWAPGLFFEVMVFVLASWNALSRPSIACPVARSVYRDGLGYFVLLATLRVLNLILSVVAPLSLMFLGI
ncbi:hypothetical protein OE88DRAFT_1659145 [Heliocybe sulcata]|uniref:DUF6533 domain-containing protein n=1 Tax=Heliocybe sulcata TaxID=5364 RepID=A0A5C3N553_9AGAM|nr:hypothetical protein OE88DRAFT_1659145 [Heliocybe sulcata]